MIHRPLASAAMIKESRTWPRGLRSPRATGAVLSSATASCAVPRIPPQDEDPFRDGKTGPIEDCAKIAAAALASTEIPSWNENLSLRGGSVGDSSETSSLAAASALAAKEAALVASRTHAGRAVGSAWIPR